MKLEQEHTVNFSIPLNSYLVRKMQLTILLEATTQSEMILLSMHLIELEN
jgi:hypothetical protein